MNEQDNELNKTNSLNNLVGNSYEQFEESNNSNEDNNNSKEEEEQPQTQKTENSIEDIEDEEEPNEDIKKKYPYDIEYSKSEIIEQINKIFLNNAQFSSVENDYFISQQKIISILTKSKVISKDLVNKSEVDVILKSINKKSKYNLIDFINFLTRLVHKIYGVDFEEHPKEVMNFFFCSFFNNFDDFLNNEISNNYIENPMNNNCTVKTIETIITTEIESDVAALLNSLYYTFKSLYEFYFQNEINPRCEFDKLQQLSLKDAITFCKDFEILPFLVNESQFVTYFNFVLKYLDENPNALKEILNNEDEANNNLALTSTKNVTTVKSSGKATSKDKGRCYKLSMFMTLFYHFSLIVYYKQIQLNFTQKKESEINIVVFFLERLENSKGIQRYLNKKGRTNNSSKITFIPTNQVLKKLNSQLYERPAIEKTNFNEKGKLICKEGSRVSTIIDRKLIKEFNTMSMADVNKVKKFELKKFLNLNQDLIQLIEENLEGLSEIYLQYSRISDKTTFNRMALSSYIKFLKKADIIMSIPDKLKKFYLALGNSIMKKQFNVSQIKQFNAKEKSSISQNQATLTDDEKLYQQKISLLVNSRINKKEGKISEGEASVIFYSLTGPKNFDNTKKIKLQFDKNSGTQLNFGDTFQTAASFDIQTKLKLQQNIPSKMDFFLFLKSFEVIAARLYPENTLNDAYFKLFTTKIQPILPENHLINSVEIQKVIEKLNTQKIKEFIIKLAPVIQPYYNVYSDKDNNMRFSNYFEFYKNYSLFPDLINLIQLKNIFFTLSETRNGLLSKAGDNITISASNTQRSLKEGGSTSGYTINFSLFVESLAISAMFFDFKDFMSDMDKMLFLIERINQSKSGNIVQINGSKELNINKGLSEFLQSMRKEYPENTIRKVKIKMEREKKDIKFDQVYEENNINTMVNSDNTM